MDIQDDTDEINHIEDVLVAHHEAYVARDLALGVDSIGFGDDYGTQEALFFSMPVWRRFFKPRYDRLMAPVREAGKDIHFHCCGRIGPLLPELAELGVTSIWPQLPAFDLPDLAKTCRELNMAIALHVERSHLMTFGSPEAIRRYVAHLAGLFRRPDGGAWWYLEVDPGFPWENVEALFAAVNEHR